MRLPLSSCRFVVLRWSLLWILLLSNVWCMQQSIASTPTYPPVANRERLFTPIEADSSLIDIVLLNSQAWYGWGDYFAARTRPVTNTPFSHTRGLAVTSLALTTPATTLVYKPDLIVTLTATLSGFSNLATTTATVQFTRNGQAIPDCMAQPIIEGKASCSLIAPAAATYSLAANFAGDAANAPSQAQALSVVVNKASQAIEFFPLPTRWLNSGDFSLSANGGGATQPVTFTSRTPSVCTTSGTNGASVHLLAAGTCTLEAQQAGDDNYLAAPTVTQTFDVRVRAPNQAPVLGCVTDQTLSEIHTDVVANLCATDDYDTEGLSLVFQLAEGGGDDNLFFINRSSGVIRFNKTPDYEQPQDADKNNTYELAVQVCDSEGSCSKAQLLTISISDVEEQPTPILHFHVKAFLQGSYDAKSGLMSDSLRTAQLLPASQPYKPLPFQYDGTETLGSAVTALQGKEAMVDWVLVELRDPISPNKILAQQAAILQRDGDVVDAKTADSLLTFTGYKPANYYVSLRHRNHLGVMTGLPLALDEQEIAVIDFTQPITDVYGNNARLVSGEVALLWAGDINADGRIIASGANNDVTNLISQVLAAPANTGANLNYRLNGYNATDVNMDGVTLFSGIGNEMNSLLGNVMVHPDNKTASTNFIVSGRIPH